MRSPQFQEHNEHDEHDEVYRLIMAGWMSQVIRTLATLSIAETLSSDSLTAAQIARRAHSDPAMTYRVLRAGVALGFLQYDRDTSRFSATSRLQILHQDSPFSLKHYAQTAGGPAFWLSGMRLPETVIRGRNYSEEMLGGDIWNYFAEHPGEAAVFRTAMSELSTPVIREATAAIGDVTGKFVLDVGGANGAFLAELLRHNSQLRGAVLDLPPAMDGVADTARRCGLSDRMTGIAGDFFDTVPVADLYLLKFILHDWNDDRCIKILSNIRRSMMPEARLFVVEMVIADSPTSMSAVSMDIAMMHSFTGQEREIAEFGNLLHAAELDIVATTDLHQPYQLIEVQPTEFGQLGPGPVGDSVVMPR